MKHLFPMILTLLILSLTGCGSKAEGTRTFTQIDQETAKQMKAGDLASYIRGFAIVG